MAGSGVSVRVIVGGLVFLSDGFNLRPLVGLGFSNCPSVGFSWNC